MRAHRLRELRQEPEPEVPLAARLDIPAGDRPRKPRLRGPAIRSSMWVTTCSAVARPKRASSAAGIRAVFSIVPVARRGHPHPGRARPP